MFCLLRCAPGSSLPGRLAAGLYLDTGHNTLDTRTPAQVQMWKHDSLLRQIKSNENHFFSQKQCM